MTRAYSFGVDVEARAFCDEILNAMARLHGVSEAEALGRINRQWGGLAFEKEDIRYHETAEFWASDILYGHGSYWWRHPPNLKPTPFP